jgi:hypothetical protein
VDRCPGHARIVATSGGDRRPQASGGADDPRIIEETRQYIRDFDGIADTTRTAPELYERMLQLYPDRLNPGVLWSSAQALKSNSNALWSAARPLQGDSAR